MQLPIEIKQSLTHSGYPLRKVERVTGGDINIAARITTTDSRVYFLKYNTGNGAADILLSELKGLDLLRSKGTIVPQVHFHDLKTMAPFIIMEWIGTGERSVSKLAKALAQLHSNTAELYGLDHSNHIGSLSQSNKQYSDFSEYYITNRMEPHVKMARDQGFNLKVNFEKFQRVLLSEIPIEPPSLIHGDLWSGNLMDGVSGPVFIDPSVSYGHREMDLAMMRLFGGFGREVYRQYEELFPLVGEWQERSDLFQLYYLLVHLNLFGESYRGQVEAIFKKYLK